MSDKFAAVGQSQGGNGGQIVIGAVLAYFYGKYAFSNPDDVECWAGAGETISAVQDDLHPTNVSANFHNYFLIQFINTIAGIAAPFIMVLGAKLQAPGLFSIGGSILGLGGCLSLAMLITGSVFRWRHEGAVCSGSFVPEEATLEQRVGYLWSSGSFINIWLIIQYSLFGLICLACCCGICVMAMSR